MENAKNCKSGPRGYSSAGCPVGETHPRAKLTDREVELIRELYGQPDEQGRAYGYRRLAAMFEVSKSFIRYVVKGERRWQEPVEYR